jgi:hypothetical protein
MRQLANKRRSDRVLKVGDSVYLKLQPYKQKSVLHHHHHKLAAKYYSSYTVIKKIGEVAYKQIFPCLQQSILFSMSPSYRGVWGTKWCTMIYLMDPKNLRYNPKQSKIEG